MSARDELIGIAQLVLGWTILAIATWLIGRLYGFPVFYADPEADLDATSIIVDDMDGSAQSSHPSFSMPSALVRGGRSHTVSGTGRRLNRETGNGGDDFVKLWTGAELVFFCILATLACLLFYCCRHHRQRSKTWLFHLIVDPTFVTLAGVPLLLMDGLPRLSTLRRCLLSLETMKAPPGGGFVHHAHTGPGSLLTAVHQQSTGAHSVTSEVDLYDECLSMTSFTTINASLSAEARHHFITAYQDRKYSSISDWLGVLEAAIALPIVLRLVRRRYKMPWSSLLHSQFYLIVQGLDLAGLMSLAVETVTGGNANVEGQRRAVRLTAEVAVYLAAVYLCVCCMALATPPIYIGGHRTTQRYLSFLMLSGTFVQDIPFLAIRLWAAGVAHSEYNATSISSFTARIPRGGCLFHILLVKSLCSVIAAVIALSMKPKSRDQYKAETGSLTASGVRSGSSSPLGESRDLMRRVVGGTSLITSTTSFDRRSSSGGHQLLIDDDILDVETDEHFV